MRLTLATPRAWSRPGSQVVTGPRPPGTLTLADLATRSIVEPLGARLTDPDGTPFPRPRRALFAVHLAVGALLDAVAAPSALDRCCVGAGPDQLGAVLGRRAGDGPREVVGSWAAQRVVLGPDPAGSRAGATLRDLLDPVLVTAGTLGRISRRTLHTIVEDSLVAACGRLQPKAPDPLWANAFLTATGYTCDRPRRSVRVTPDAGAPVAVAARRVCCALSARPTPDACPSCPLHAERDRAGLVRQWLQEVDDETFVELTGRPRARPQHTPVPRPGPEHR